MALVAVCGNFSAASGRGSPFHSLGSVAKSVARTIKDAGVEGYKYVQVPAANVTSTVDSSNHSVSTIGANSGANSGNSGKIAGTSITDATSVPTVVNATPPVVVTQPAPVIVPPCVVAASGVGGCQEGVRNFV